MHEMALTGSLVELVIHQATICEANRVIAVHLKIGDLRDVIDNLLKGCFQHLAKGTIAQDAIIEIDHIPMIVLCNECQKEFSADPMYLKKLSCPHCGMRNFSLVSGREFYVEDIEIA